MIAQFAQDPPYLNDHDFMLLQPTGLGSLTANVLDSDPTVHMGDTKRPLTPRTGWEGRLQHGAPFTVSTMASKRRSNIAMTYPSSCALRRQGSAPARALPLQ